ncbi:MAG: NADH-quinone oxidoreductase subunit A [Aquificaceae bacterium]|nr:NADH-quinone oxidoreductase subunit A [Aquificaceae bacterium]
MEYLGILLFFFIAVLLGLAFSFLNNFLGPRTKEKLEGYPYECGVPVYDQEAKGVFKQGYYLLGISLILFDIEVAFLFPWVVVFKEVGLYGLAGALLFIFILTLGLAYEWRKGALRWQL